MKKLKKIEASRFDMNPDAKLSPEEMSRLEGGAGCICLKNRFILNGFCVCDHNPFGLCTGVTSGGSSDKIETVDDIYR